MVAGVRFYLPDEELGVITPHKDMIRVPDFDLPPNGWAAVSGDRTAGSLNVREDGVAIQRAWSDEYDFVREAGRMTVQFKDGGK